MPLAFCIDPLDSMAWMTEEPSATIRYTRESANAMLSEIRGRVERLRDAYAELAGHHAKVRSLLKRNGGEKDDSWLRAPRELAEQIRWLNENGIVIRDVEQGLIDFPSEREGRDVFLCWRLGEESVDFWHEIDTGFAGRKPLD